MRSDLLVIKSATAFLCARQDGDIRPPTTEGEGLYHDDVRFLSELRLTLGGADPVLLASSAESGHRAAVTATNRGLEGIPDGEISITRTVLIDGRLQVLVELESFAEAALSAPLDLWLAADFADLFEVRGAFRRASERAPARPPRADRSAIDFAREGADGLVRETVVELDPQPAVIEVEAGRVHVGWEITLAPRSTGRVLLTITPVAQARRPPPRPFAQTAAELDREATGWLQSCTEIKTDNELTQQVIDASMRDLHALMTPANGGTIPAAGIPWYVAPFGRDSLLTALECLILNPAIARETLRVLAALQAREDDPWRDAEPGKILHELRAGELARAGLIPHTPYYGTVDATPLFVALTAAYFRWTADLETMHELAPALEAALAWIDRYGDLDGDGFIEYLRRSPGGLRNQGWKDWDEAIVHTDGRLAEGPIALVEAQGYVYLAKTQIADVYDALGEADEARELRTQALRLREAFNEVFWNPDQGTFALALDGAKRQVASVSSNPGHCLYCGIVDDDKAAQVAQRLMAPDMFSGWGIRTLSAAETAYNPMSYHVGSVWPHDNALIAVGLRRYGHHEAAARVASAIFEIAARSHDHRLAELYCGFARQGRAEVVGYPVACIPQAWAAAAPFMLLEAILGLEADAPAGKLLVAEPTLPRWIGHVELDRLKVGAAIVNVTFADDGSPTLEHVEGRLGGFAVR